MRSLRQKLSKTLSSSFFLCLSCLPRPASVVLPPPASLPTSVPVELRIGKVETDGDSVKLTPLQASNLAAQIRYFQALVGEGYRLGRQEGDIALNAMSDASIAMHKNARRKIAYSALSFFAIGMLVGVSVAEIGEK